MMGSLCTPHPPSSPGPTQLMIITLSSGFPTRVPNFNLIARSPPLLSSLLQCSASSSESTRLRGPELARTASLSFSALWRNFPRSVPVLFWSLVRRGREKERKGGGRGKEGGQSLHSAPGLHRKQILTAYGRPGGECDREAPTSQPCVKGKAGGM